MTSRRVWRFSFAVLFLIWTPELIRAQPAADASLLDTEAMAARIDHHIAEACKEKRVKPAPRTDDAEFFRRLSLDLNGCIPSLVHVKDFLDDNRPNKRQIWVNKLMDGRDPDFVKVDKKLPTLFVNHFTNVWRNVFFRRTSNQQLADLGFRLDPWLRRVLQENRPYDALVTELYTGQGQPFFQANENRPENLAGTTTRLFLGLRLECAQCHEDRSGAAWTQQQFWEFAAFFVQAPPTKQPVDSKKSAEVLAPSIKFNKDRVVEARFLDGQKPSWKAGDNPRATLAKWLTSAENPYFAKAAVNRMWHHFFGMGLTDPVDLMAIKGNPPSHPELLDELAYQFAAHRFDLRYLIRAITYSETYQRTSAGSDVSQDDPRMFARMAVRGLSPDQLFDSLLIATQQEIWPPAMNQGPGGPNDPRAEFRRKFANVKDNQTETQTETLQALYLMNSKFVKDAVERQGGSLHTIIRAGDQVPMTRRLEELYFITLSRRPRPAEMDRLLKHVRSGETADDALADIFWALLNSAGFRMNH